MIIFYNSNIVTLDKNKPHATAMVVDGKQIIALGESDILLTQVPSTCKKVDVGKRTILPGFTDSHIHTLQYGQSLSRINCETSTKHECLIRVKEIAQKTEPGKWIIGHGWNQNHWAQGYGNYADLDEISRVHPIYLTSKSLHASWANSLALKLAGVTVNTSNPFGGIIQRNERGQPTGILLDNAIPLIEKYIPPPSPAEIQNFLLTAQRSLLSLGITAVHDFDKENCLFAFMQMDKMKQLSLHVIKSIPLDYLDIAISEGLKTGKIIRNLEIGALKLFSDGALGSRTAALFLPYEGEPENVGLLIQPLRDLIEIGCKAVAGGFSLAVHAIGDRALNMVLQSFTKILTNSHNLPHLPHMHRIEHVQLAQPEDIKTMGRLGLVASMQPIHAPSDREMALRYWGDRTKYAYPLRSVQEAGVLSVYGSDAPVENPNPFFGIAAAVCRKVQGDSESFHPEQRINLAQAVVGFCSNPHSATGHGQKRGILKQGFTADFTIIDKNPFAIEPLDIYNINVHEVFISGINVFSR